MSSQGPARGRSTHPASSVRLPGTGRRAKSIDLAVNLMYAGAALEVLKVILTLVLAGTIKADIKESLGDSVAQDVLDDTLRAFNLQMLVGGLIAIALWLLMARLNAQGKSSARIIATVLFAISTISLLFRLLSVTPIVLITITVVSWIIGLAAVIYLWRPDSSAFFTRAANRRGQS
ncbi:hypothetical protein [Demetria terragena]|uniref:hypothetical protein n=1 Tax=Demetria terragena TaxID=63959 RepID=UPI0003747AD9|nr:hypothetical protein [Demetria terragena]